MADRSPPAASRRERVGWYFYDWANSAFYTTVVTVFLGPYLTTVAKAASDGRGFVYPLGIPVRAGSFFPYVVSLSVALQVLFLPILGAMADYSHRKKEMLAGFAYLGALATAAMYFLEGTNYLLGGGLFLVANLAFGASVVFYNSFLPDLASPDERDSVSSMGWAVGYLGGGLLLALNLALFSSASAIGIESGDAVRISLCSAGVWWAVFTLIPMATLRNREPSRRPPKGEGLVSAGFRQLTGTFRNARNYPKTLLFLGAYVLYNDGIQTVIAMSSEFGQEELGLPLSTLTTVILMVQFVAFLGSLAFNRVAMVVGTRNAIVASLLVWTGTLFYAYAYLRTAYQYYWLAAIIALVLGGSQALSRSLFSLMIPKGQEAEYFSLYEVTDRGTSWLGPLLFGLALQFTGSYRIAILSLAVFFVGGLFLMLGVNVRKAVIEAGNEPP
ncbi:MAG TPA: MFS transporter [Candidatus Deferrimicrobiaceae bacterium]|nr:MFS transporter [Candidatus Deferrimicrobiaceae bacterium]